MFLETYQNAKGQTLCTITVLSDGRFWPTLDSTWVTPTGTPVRSHRSLGVFDSLEDARQKVAKQSLAFHKRKTIERTPSFTRSENYYPNDPARSTQKYVSH